MIRRKRNKTGGPDGVVLNGQSASNKDGVVTYTGQLSIVKTVTGNNAVKESKENNTIIIVVAGVAAVAIAAGVYIH